MLITLIRYTVLKLLLLSFESDTCLILKKTCHTIQRREHVESSYVNEEKDIYVYLTVRS